MLQVSAGRYTARRRHGLIPTGELADVAGTPFDFRDPKPIGRDLPGVPTPPGGYDHNYALDGGRTDRPRPVARLTDPASGRSMEVLTTEPGVQVYTGNVLSGERGKAGATYGRHAGVCLECQHYPDSPNRPAFPSTVLRPGQTYRQTTVYRFTAG